MNDILSMKTSVVMIAFFLFSSCSGGNSNQITVTNPVDMERTDELVVLKRSDIEAKTGAIPAGRYTLVMLNNQPLVVQYDDMNGDGNWDELAFLYHFKPKEAVSFSFSISDAPATIKAVVRAHVRHRKKNAGDSFGEIITKDTMPPGNPPADFSKVVLPPYLTEGPAWENDKVAFRLYFDTRNGKDVFGKRMPGMVMDTIGADHNNSYHEPADWGMDVLHVGKSLGAGSVAFKIKNAGGLDTLIRLGGPIVKNETYEAVADGPVRAIFRIKYECEIDGRAVQVIDETSIWGGQYFYETKLYTTGLPSGARLVAGFADFYDNQPGQIDTEVTKVFYSYGPQSENKDNLGLAIAIHTSDFSDYRAIKDTTSAIQSSYAVSQKIIAGKPIVYRFYSGWEKSDELFTSETRFRNFLKSQAALFNGNLVYDRD